jgi:hypothetical protein
VEPLKIDCHFHSNLSDGAFGPADVVRTVGESGVRFGCLSDHDTLWAYESDLVRSGDGLILAPAVEVSTTFEAKEDRREEVHVLAYGLEAKADAVRGWMRELYDEKNARMKKVCRQLAEKGFPVDFDAAMEDAGPVPVCAPHVVVQLVMRGALEPDFDKIKAFVLAHLGLDMPDYIFHDLPTSNAVSRIKALGGIAVLAHPGKQKLLSEILAAWDEVGFDGIEAYHVDHDGEFAERMSGFALARGALVSAGTDYHGYWEGEYSPEYAVTQDVLPFLRRVFGDAPDFR